MYEAGDIIVLHSGVSQWEGLKKRREKSCLFIGFQCSPILCFCFKKVIEFHEGFGTFSECNKNHSWARLFWNGIYWKTHFLLSCWSAQTVVCKMCLPCGGPSVYKEVPYIADLKCIKECNRQHLPEQYGTKQDHVVSIECQYFTYWWSIILCTLGNYFK